MQVSFFPVPYFLEVPVILQIMFVIVVTSDIDHLLLETAKINLAFIFFFVALTCIYDTLANDVGLVLKFVYCPR